MDTPMFGKMREMGGSPMKTVIMSEGKSWKLEASCFKDCANEDIGHNMLCIPYFGKWEKEWVGLLID